MRIDILTLFPEMCETVLGESIIGRAREKGLVEINCTNIRDFSKDKHRKTDDTPYGGGMGMLMTAQPVTDCYNSFKESLSCNKCVIYMSPKGKILDHNKCTVLT